MSFLRKLFGGSDEPPTTPGSLAHDQFGTEPSGQNVDEEPTGSAARPQEGEQRGTAPLVHPDRDDDDAPQETEPRADSPASAWWDEVGDELEQPESDAQQPTGGGTAPLDQDSPADDEAAQLAPAQSAAPERAPESSPTDQETAPREEPEEDGTRPLTTADVPAIAALRSRQGFATAALRDIGRVRSINQDSVFALTTTLPREGNDITMGLFIVADGMGGHAGGEIASRLAISTVARHILTELVIPALTDNVTEVLQPLVIAAVQEANRAIWEYAQSLGSDMGTTCTAALLLGQALYIAHVGDSRAYLVTPTGMRLITTDHSTVGRLIQLGQLHPSEAREHPLRSQLYRTIGQQPEVLVDFIYQPIGDATHLLLCSDGLWGMLDEEILLDVLEHAIWPQDACRELVARANLAGGDDNIAAIVVGLPALSST